MCDKLEKKLEFFGWVIVILVLFCLFLVFNLWVVNQDLKRGPLHNHDLVLGHSDYDNLKYMKAKFLEKNCSNTIYFWPEGNQLNKKHFYCEQKICLRDGFCKSNTTWWN